MPQDPNVKFRGKKLDATSFEKVCGPALLLTNPYIVSTVQMSSEQLGQLYELMHAAKDVWKPIQVAGGEEEGKS